MPSAQLQSFMLLSDGRTDDKAEALILWLLDTKSRLIGNDSDAGKD